MESWPNVNLEQIIGGAGETYPDHRQKNTDGTKNGLCWCRAGDLLRKVHCLDGHIQQGEGIALTFLSLGIRIHG